MATRNGFRKNALWLSGRNFYFILGAIFCLSLLIVLVVPESFWKGLAATPAILSLLGSLFKLFQDQAAHERQMELQRKQQIFNLGSASHMANVAFDKHVEFCEEYMAAVQGMVTGLYGMGPTKEIKNFLNKLQSIRIRFAVWLDEEISSELNSFENVLQKIYSLSEYIESTEGDRQREEIRKQRIDEMYKLYETFLGLGGPPSDKKIVGHTVQGFAKKIQGILDIEKLSAIRKILVDESHDFINS